MRQLLLLLALFMSAQFYSQSQAPEIDWISGFQRMSGSGGHCVLIDIEVSEDGNIYLLSSFYGLIDINPWSGLLPLASNGSSDLAIVKLNSYGKLIWAKQIGGPGLEYGFRVKVSPNENVIVSGIFEDSLDLDPSAGVELHYSNGGWDGFAIILNSMGDFIQGKAIGGPGYDAIFDIEFDQNDQCWISGRFEDSVDLNPEGISIFQFAQNGTGSFIAKVDSNFQFEPTISMSAGESCGIVDFDISQNGLLHYVCYFTDTLLANYPTSNFQKISNGEMDALYGIADLNGNELEHLHFGGEKEDMVYSLVEMKDNRFALFVTYADSLKFQLNGTDIYVSGNNDAPSNNAHLRNTAILKLNGMEIEWIKTVNAHGSGAYAECYPFGQITVDDHDNLYLALLTTGTCSVNQSNMNTFGSVNSSGSVVTRLNSDGIFTGIYTLEGSGYIDVKTIEINNEHLFLGTEQNGNIDFDFSEATEDFYVNGALIAKYDLQNTTLFTENIDPTASRIYPNPASNFLNVPTLDAQNISVFDLSGREINVEQEVNSSGITINTSNLSEGTYLLRCTIHDEFLSQRFVVQH